THHLKHFLLHFLRRRLSLMRSYHPGVAVRIHDGATPIPPKHVHHWTLPCSSEADRFGNYLVHLFHVEKQTCWRGANTLCTRFTESRVFRSQHQRRAA